MALDKIVVPGGGQNDIWHNLTCKGRYAGELRIELTYYDTRPKENKTEDRRQFKQDDGAMEDTRAGLSGPRQPKKRPLPADPTGLTRPVHSAQTPPSLQQQSYGTPPQHFAESPDDYYTPPQELQHDQYQDQSHTASPLAYQLKGHGEHYTASSHPPLPNLPNTAPPRNIHEAPHDTYENINQVAPKSSPQYSHSNTLEHDFSQGYDDGRYNPPHGSYATSYPAPAPVATLPLQESASLQSRVPPRVAQPQTLASARSIPQYHRSSLSHSVSADVSPIQPPHKKNSMEGWLDPHSDSTPNEDPPPQPPVHRTSMSKLPLQSNECAESPLYAQAPAPAPLNIRNHRVSAAGSPLTQIHSANSNHDYVPQASSDSYPFSHAADSTSSQASHSRIRQHRSLSPFRKSDQPTPPSLVPGYEPSIAADESDMLLREQRLNLQRDYATQQPPFYQQNSAPPRQGRSQPLTRNAEMSEDRRVHRNSVPVIKPQAISPNPRTPIRKSVSPRPDSLPAERRHSELPFSPDSFNAFNPSVDTAVEANQSGARYTTPEQAREASIQHDRDIKRGEGPIIGSDGRIIDPSDHLPTDTWAPEPEQKTSRKGPEVTLRFRHSPQSTQPMPQGGRRPLTEARPNTMSSPIFAHSAENSPTSANRARLQKRSRMGAGQPNSSPIVPTLETSSPRHSMPRSSASDYPLRERENGSYANSSPTYGNRSPGEIAPPVPRKIPIGSAQEDWANSVLSEEMSRIDIGVGGGHRSRARRYGF